jgi:hypothetical protein
MSLDRTGEPVVLDAATDAVPVFLAKLLDSNDPNPAHNLPYVIPTVTIVCWDGERAGNDIAGRKGCVCYAIKPVAAEVLGNRVYPFRALGTHQVNGPVNLNARALPLLLRHRDCLAIPA